MICDISIVIFLVLFMLNGYRKGFVKSVYSLVSLVATILVLFVFGDAIISQIAASPVGVAIGEFFAENTGDIALIKSCSGAFVYLVSSIALYIVLKFSLKFILRILESIASLPLINMINKLLGIVLGLACGIMWAVIILNVLCIFPQTETYVMSSEIIKYFDLIFI